MVQALPTSLCTSKEAPLIQSCAPAVITGVTRLITGCKWLATDLFLCLFFSASLFLCFLFAYIYRLVLLVIFLFAYSYLSLSTLFYFSSSAYISRLLLHSPHQSLSIDSNVYLFLPLFNLSNYLFMHQFTPPPVTIYLSIFPALSVSPLHTILYLLSIFLSANISIHPY